MSIVTVNIVIAALIAVIIGLRFLVSPSEKRIFGFVCGYVFTVFGGALFPMLWSYTNNSHYLIMAALALTVGVLDVERAIRSPKTKNSVPTAKAKSALKTDDDDRDEAFRNSEHDGD